MSNLLFGEIQKALHGGPKKPPKPPEFNPPPPPPPEKKIEAPSGAPTEASNAFKADEQRRMLGALPKPIQTKYAGDETDPTKPKTKKQKLLGGGVGQQTSGV